MSKEFTATFDIFSSIFDILVLQAPMNGTWTREDIAGKPAEVYQPAGPARPRFGVLFLHPIGNETLVDRPAFTRLLDELALACVCPLAPYTWWTDRICP